MGVPIKRSNHEVMGVIGLTHLDEPGTFAVETIETLERAAGLTAVILDNLLLVEELRLCDQKFRQLAENIDEAFWLRTHEKVHYVSSGYEKLWGRSCDSFIERPESFLDAVHMDDRDRLSEIFSSERYVKFGLYEAEYRIVRPDGSIRWVLARTFPVDGNAVDLRAGIAVDITSRKLSEDELRCSEERYRRLSSEMIREINAAAKVQRALLPSGFSSSRLSIRTIYQPYQTVSGDLFGYEWVEENRQMRGFLVDVTGHGIGTAFHSAAMNVLFHQVVDKNVSLVDSLRWINQQAEPFFAEGNFGAAIFFDINLEAGALRYVSAGFPYFLLSTDEKTGWVEAPGSLIGVSDSPEFEERTICIAAGDTIYFMTDGLQEKAIGVALGDIRDFEATIAILSDLPASTGCRDDATALCFCIGDSEPNINK